MPSFGAEVRLALDTNRYRDLTDGDREVYAILEYADAVYVPFVVVAELRSAFAVGNGAPATRGTYSGSSPKMASASFTRARKPPASTQLCTDSSACKALRFQPATSGSPRW